MGDVTQDVLQGCSSPFAFGGLFGEELHTMSSQREPLQWQQLLCNASVHAHLQLQTMQLLQPCSVHMLWIHSYLSFGLIIIIIVWMNIMAPMKMMIMMTMR